MISWSNESQSKAQFNLQDLGENKTGFCVENIKFISTDKNRNKHLHLFTIHFHINAFVQCIFSENALPFKAMRVCYQLN